MAAYWLSTGGQMVKLPVSTSTGRRRSSGTSIQPSRQPVIEKYLLNEPKTTPVREVCQALRGLHAVGDPVVDLVADQPHQVLLAPAGDRGELVGRHHRAGGVGGRRDDEAGDHPLDRRELCDGRLEPGLGPAVDLDDLAAEGGEHVAVAGVAGTGHHHPVARLEGGQEGQQESARRTGGDDHVVEADVDPARPTVVGRHRLAQTRAPRSRPCSRAPPRPAAAWPPRGPPWAHPSRAGPRRS